MIENCTHDHLTTAYHISEVIRTCQDCGLIVQFVAEEEHIPRLKGDELNDRGNTNSTDNRIRSFQKHSQIKLSFYKTKIIVRRFCGLFHSQKY